MSWKILPLWICLAFPIAACAQISEEREKLLQQREAMRQQRGNR